MGCPFCGKNDHKIPIMHGTTRKSVISELRLAHNFMCSNSHLSDACFHVHTWQNTIIVSYKILTHCPLVVIVVISNIGCSIHWFIKSLTHYPLIGDGCDFKYISPSTSLLWCLLMGEWYMTLQIINEHCFCYLPNALRQQAIAARNSVWGHWCNTMALGPCYFFLLTEVSHSSFECHIHISEHSTYIHCDYNCYITNICAQCYPF